MKRLALAAACAAAFAASALPAFGNGSSGTINATISVEAPCITVSPETPVAFPSQPYSQPDVVSPSRSFGSGMSLTNCSSGPERVFARGSDATAPGASWELVPIAAGNPCPLGIDRYHLALAKPGGGAYQAYLTKTNQVLVDLANQPNAYVFAAGSVNALLGILTMPCAGSSGAGEEMAFQIVLTATF
jgi:hypothetical protein